MSLAATLPAPILETVLAGLATLFLAGANGDIAAARNAASHMLGAYRPQTENELRLAANIVGFSFQALNALAQAAAPGIPLTRILRLRGSAVSLSRESNKAERRLAQLQKAGNPAIAVEKSPPEAALPLPVIEQAPAPTLRPTSPMQAGKIAQAAKANGITWRQAYDNRQRDIRIAASVKRAESRAAANPNPAATTASVPLAQPVAEAA